jgi:hypothetical protein
MFPFSPRAKGGTVSRLDFSSLAVVASLLLASSVRAGTPPACFGPDGLDGACCQSPTLTLPTFPAIVQRGRFLNFDQCVPGVHGPVCVNLRAPRTAPPGGAPVCGIYLIPLTISTCGPRPQSLWSGTMRAQYSRTWLETRPPSSTPDVQVWRFLLNGDLVPSLFMIQHFGNDNQVLPHCFTAFHGKVHFWGYVDYAQNCATGSFEAAWVLEHGCDHFEHEALSTRTGSFHPMDSYTFLGPGGSFASSPIVPPVSAAGRDHDFRPNRWSNQPNICMGEEPLTSDSLVDGNPFCPCIPTGPPVLACQFLELSAVGTCNSRVHSDPNFAIPFCRKFVGSFTDPNAYPGVEEVWLDQGMLQYSDACDPLTIVTELFKGVETIGGFDAFDMAGAALGNRFDDLGSANTGRSFRPSVAGAPYVSWELLHLNQ